MSKKSRKEGNRVACLIKANKTEFYIADVDLDDSSDDVVGAMNSIVKTLGKVRAAFMIISAGIKVITILSYVPDELGEKLDKDLWLKKSIIGLPDGITDSGDNYVRTVVETTTPFKLKDMVRGNGFAYLTKLGLMGDEESSEELPDFDDL